MSDNIQMIKSLLDYVESYQKEVGNGDLKEFSIYLKDKLVSSNFSSKSEELNEDNYLNYKVYPQVEFSTLLTGLYRYAKHYLKKTFSKTSFKSIDEFGFLATLLKEKSLLKNELITRHLLEFSSGSEILKRLINSKLVKEFPDEIDKRAKRVSLTEKGTKEIISAFEEMFKVSEIIIGNLSKTELNEALFIFNKLTYFHQHIYETDKQTELLAIHSKYVEHKN